MTTNDQRIDATPSTEDAQLWAEPAEPEARPTDSPRGDLAFDAECTPPAEPNLSSVRPQHEEIDSETTPAPAGSRRPDAESSSETPLFAAELLTSLRARWGEVQAVFVDDPRACVQKADGLVADVVEQLVTSFAGARSHLERQWDRGGEASTEDLRVALKRYREFFDRLLEV